MRPNDSSADVSARRKCRAAFPQKQCVEILAGMDRVLIYHYRECQMARELAGVSQRFWCRQKCQQRRFG